MASNSMLLGTTVSVGQHVPALWSSLTRQEPQQQHSLSRARDDTTTSDSGPAWMGATNRVPSSSIPEWDWITYDRKAHLHKATEDDTQNSVDAPLWFHPELKAMGAPQQTRHYSRHNLGGRNQIVLKPLVEEVDGKLYALGPVKPRPGAIREGPPPEPGASRRMASTASTVIGAGDVAHQFRKMPRVVSDRRGLTSAADAVPVVDPFGATGAAGEALRVREAGRSLGARAAHLERAGALPGGAAAGPPMLVMTDGAAFVPESPHSSYYAWKRAAAGELALYGVPGLGRGTPAHQAGELVGHHAFYKMGADFTTRGHHLHIIVDGVAEAHSKLLAETGALAPASTMTGRSGGAALPPRLRDEPLRWYSAKR
jgi:hypothetical protein